MLLNSGIIDLKLVSLDHYNIPINYKTRLKPIITLIKLSKLYNDVKIHFVGPIYCISRFCQDLMQK